MWGLSHMSQHLSESQALYSGWNSWCFLGCKDLKDTDHLAEYSTQNKGQWMSTDPRKRTSGGLRSSWALIQGAHPGSPHPGRRLMSISMEPGGSSQSCLTIPMAKYQGSQDQVRGQVTGESVCFCSLLELTPVTQTFLYCSSHLFKEPIQALGSGQPHSVVLGNGYFCLGIFWGHRVLVRRATVKVVFWFELRAEGFRCLYPESSSIHSAFMNMALLYFRHVFREKRAWAWEAKRSRSTLALRLPVCMALGPLWVSALLSWENCS